ncbi:MAG: 50S ribosomal protein L18 [Cephaloticoccus sp.]|nr:50S ribosomal protein L18 [Cephaloticoccus sp.]MCF7759079.1 50S ribosomal protein L18 [Cephaloticoccus sp.]
MNTIRKSKLLQKRRWRIRKKVTGTAVRPRLCVKFSGKHIYAQAVDDEKGATLAFLSSLDADLRQKKLSANVVSAKELGTAFAVKAVAAGIGSVVFDRSGARYHGKVKQFADAAREGGLKF